MIGPDPAEDVAIRLCGDGRARRSDRIDRSDVYRGVQHRVQMRKPPGATITVNARGEPRA